MSPELLMAAEEAYVVAEVRRNRQRGTFKNGRRQLRCTRCGCWRAKRREDGEFPTCRRCGNTDAPRVETIYPRPENTPTWERFLAAFAEECAEAERRAERRACHADDPIPF